MTDIIEVNLTIKKGKLLRALQFTHSYLNKRIFNNELTTALIKSSFNNYGDEKINEEIEAIFKPYDIIYNINVIEFNLEDVSDEIDKEELYYYAVILLHEMIHQYCYENKIEDITNGEHNDNFREIASKYKLKMGGYELQDDFKEEMKGLALRLIILLQEINY